MTRDPDKPLPEVIRIVEPGLLERLLSAAAGQTAHNGPDDTVTAEQAHRQLELLYATDPTFRSVLISLFRYVVDTLRVRQALDESVRRMASWAQQDWKRRSEDPREQQPAG